MILQVAASLLLLGFITWISGTVLGMHGIGTIGAVIIVGVGATIATGGLDYKVGEIETVEDDKTTTEGIYESVGDQLNFSIGTILMLLGGVATIRSINLAGSEP